MPSIEVAPEALPTNACHIIPDSTFSRTHGSTPLPSPGEVRRQAIKNGIDVTANFRPPPVRLPELNIIVKWGTDVTIAEGQCLLFMRTKLHDKVPVPELYGWQTDGDEVFLYMELVEGETLADAWPNLDRDDRAAIAKQLRSMVDCWRNIERAGAASNTLCQIGGQALRDILFHDACKPGCYPAGPFPDLSSFHDAFARLSSWRSSDGRSIRASVEELAGLDDSLPLVFTHGDLHQSNILITKPSNEEPAKVASIIDWHQSGWYPAPWEWLKARMVATPGSDWVEEYLPEILTPAKFEYYYSFEYVSMATI